MRTGVYTTTEKPIASVFDVRPALRGQGFVPRDIDYDLEFLRSHDGEWIPESAASDFDVRAFMRPTHETFTSAHLRCEAPYTLTVRLKSYGSSITARDSHGDSFNSYYNDRESMCVIS